MRYVVFALLGAGLSVAILSAAAEQGTFDRSLTVSGPVELDVTTDSGGITVTPGSSGSVRVHAVLKAQHGWFDIGDVEERIRRIEQNPPVEQTGNRVRIGYVHDRNLLRGIEMRLEIQTPQTTQLHARADSGGIHVEGIQGPVDCQADSGGIEVRDIALQVRASADSGGIHLSNIKDSVYARADSGGIEAMDVAGSIDAQADSGGIRVSQTKASPIRAKADSGSVTVRLAPGAGYDVDVSTDSGHISIPEMTVRGGFSQHHIDGKVRSGGPLVSVRVDSGSVTVQ